MESENIEPDCICKTEMEPFFSYSYAIYIPTAEHLPYLFLCSLKVSSTTK